MPTPNDHRWSGALALGPWWLLYTGAIGPTDEHRHHAMQIMACPTAVSVALGSESVSAETIVIPADIPHRILDGSDRGAVLFVDVDARRSMVSIPTVAPSPAFPIRVDPDQMTYADAVAEVGTVLSAIGVGRTVPLALSVEIGRSISLLDDDLGASATALAGRIGLSASEFSRRFSREVGLPFRSYRKWRRLLLAVEALASGSNLTAAAHSAGFADSGHLTRTFRAMFGIAPRDLTATSRWLAPP